MGGAEDFSSSPQRNVERQGNSSFLMRAFRLFAVLFLVWSALLRADDPPPLTWRPRADVGSPGQLEGASMAFDATQGVSLLFGGDKSLSGILFGSTNELWQYDGVTWQPVVVSGVAPAARSGHSLVYDPVAGRVLLFGGDAGGGVFLNDLWAFVFSGPAAGSWQRLPDLPGAGRWGAALGYDAGRDRFVVVGGIRQGEAEQKTPSEIYSVVPATRETWLWDRTSWQPGPSSADYNNGPFGDVFDQKVVGGPLNGTLGYHATGGQLMLIAERIFPFFQLPIANFTLAGGVSTFEGSAWSRNSGGYQMMDGLAIIPNQPPIYSNLPQRAISGTRLQSAYDPARRRLVVAMGGQSKTMEFTGSNWAEYTTAVLPNYPYGRGDFGALPTARPRFCLAHDTVRGVTVYFGGKASVIAPGDTWELVENPAAPFRLTTHPEPVVEPCLGGTFTLVGEASGVAPLRPKWRRNGEVLAGQTTFSLTLANVTQADSGTYLLEVTDPSGRTLTSSPSEVFVHAPPVFTQPPTPRRVVPGEAFSVEAAWTSTLPVTVQWYKDDVLIPGGTFPIYTKDFAAVSDSGYYTVALTTRCTTVRSPSGRVMVGPVINQHPAASPNESVGSSPIGLFVSGDGVGTAVGNYTTGGNTTEYIDHVAPDSATHPRPLVFTWRHEGVPLAPGPKYTFTETALTSSLVINTPDYEDEGYYDCVIKDISGQSYAKTTMKTLRILYPLAPPYLTLPVTTPDPRVEAAMVYDSRRGRTVLFGGDCYGMNPRSSYPFPQVYQSNDTFEWDGRVWVKRNPATRPPAMRNFGMVYDSHRGRTVLFGGYKYAPPEYLAGSQVISNDLWEWDGVNWTQITPPASPPARLQPIMCFDTVRRETLMIGGTNFNPEPTDYYGARKILWGWDGAQWTQRGNLPNGGNAPYLTGGNIFAFDEERGVAAMFGPFGDNEYPVWEWNGATWKRVLPTRFRVNNTSSGTGTPFYDPVRRMICMSIVGNNFSLGYEGGTSFLACWNGAEFLRGSTRVIDDVTGVAPPIDAQYPDAISGDMTTFDTARRALVWVDNTGLYRSGTPATREMHFSAKAKPVHGPAEMIFFPNQTFSLRVISAGQRGLVQQWFKDSLPVLDDGRVTGGDNATLTITAATEADAGVYRLRVTNVYNQVFSPDIVVRWQAGGIAISGATGGGAVTLFWPGTTGVLETTTNLAGPWTRLPGATSPYSGALDEPARFYRVVYP